MIKKITILLIILLVLVGIVFGLTYMGILNNPFSSTSGTEGIQSQNWTYKLDEEGNAALLLYKGRDAAPVIPTEIDGHIVTTLGEELFAGNTRIKEVSIPNTVTELGVSVFNGCSELTTVTLSNGITTIPEKAFWGCANLKVIQLSDNLKSIGKNAFSGCSSLSYFSMPDSLTSIGFEAFSNCTLLSDIAFSKNLRDLGSHAFRGTAWLNQQDEPFVIVGNGILIQYNGIDELVEVPMGVLQITDAFENNIFPLEIILPDSLTSIGPNAFSGCRSLEVINIPAKVRSIGESAFRGCSHLLKVDLPDGLTSIGSSAFQSCSALDQVIIPEGVKRLPALAFANCDKLRVLQIPESVEFISQDVVMYSGIQELRVVKNSAGEEFANANGYLYSYKQQSNDDFIYQQLEDGVQIILYVGDIYDVVIPERLSGEPVVSLSDILFQHNAFVRTVDLPETITRIADYSFADMSELRTVKLPSTLTSIGASAFMNDVMLGDLEIPESVSEIASDAFIGCPSLVIWAAEGSYAYNWAIQNGIRVKDTKTVSAELFSFVSPAGNVLISGYNGMERELQLPRLDEYGEYVTGIADEAFKEIEISSVTIPEGYETIGELSFANNPAALEITIGRSVTDIADNCFSGTETVIHGYNGSYAEEYARQHKIKFLVILEWEL